jgi:hypothetical protein
VAVLVSGVVLAHGLLIATGLVFTGIGVQLFDVRGVQAGGRNTPSC